MGILGLVRLPALLLPVTNLLARVAGRILCWTVLSAWSVAFCAVATWGAVLMTSSSSSVLHLWLLLMGPLKDMLSMIAMYVQHTASISAVVALIFITKSFLIWSVSLRAQTIWNWMCLSFSTSVGKLHLLASPQIRSMSSPGVSPALILISSSWYILHH